MVLMAGCTAVQKGSAAGGAVGGATGAAVGHYLTGAGGVTGGVVGLGLGATAGAIAADHYYDEDESAEMEELTATVDQLSAELAEKDRTLQEERAALEKEKAQQKALLEAYEKARKGGSKTLQASAPANVQVTEGDNTITYTILSEVLFDSGQAELTAAGKSALHEAARAIRRDYPDAHIEVRGHTDNVPIRYSSHKSNWHLSCARAVAVVQHLIEAESFDPSRLAATGCGEARPIASNNTADGRRRNRRAELVVRPAAVKVAEVRASN
jgi:chemotaxis protein MotB